jgi:hypothetical protein
MAAALTALVMTAPDIALVEEAGGALVVPGADQLAGPARRTGVGFEFRRKLAIVDNPYCDIRTYILPRFPEQASSTQTADDRSVIVIDASTLKFDRPYAYFLLAHECCHHTLGHTRLTTERSGRLGLQPFHDLRPLVKNMELDANACAVRMLKLTKEPGAIERVRAYERAWRCADRGLLSDRE